MTARGDRQEPRAEIARPRVAALGRRLLSILYETLIVAALLLAVTGVFTVLIGDSRGEPWRTLLRLVLLCTVGGYLVYSWGGARQSLPMRTWRLLILDRDGQPLSTTLALKRFILAAAGMAAGGVTLLWALFDRERQFLHDRLAGTRIVYLPNPRAGTARSAAARTEPGCESAMLQAPQRDHRDDQEQGRGQ